MAPEIRGSAAAQATEVHMVDPFDMEARLCDDAGMVSHACAETPAGYRAFTYIDRLNSLRAASCLPPYDGPPFACTGHAHLAHMHIHCTSPAHTQHADAPPTMARVLGDAVIAAAKRGAA